MALPVQLFKHFKSIAAYLFYSTDILERSCSKENDALVKATIKQFGEMGCSSKILVFFY